MKARSRKIHSEARKLICAIWNKEELPEECKESIIVTVYKKDDKQTVVIKESVTFVSYLQYFIQHPLSRFIPFAEEIIWDHQCGFRRNRSTTDHIHSTFVK